MADGQVRASTVVALGMVLVGIGSLGAITYADLTGDVTRADYEAYASNCDSLANETRLAETGLGREPRDLNRTAVQRCRNTTFAEYRQAQVESMRTTPFNPLQWLLYGGFGLAITVAGGVLLCQELRR